jgi:Ras-related protein Rab-11A
MSEAEEFVKVCVIGEEDVGKKTLVGFFEAEGGKADASDVIEAEFELSDSTKVTAVLWTWSPHKNIDGFGSFCQNASAIVFVFDISRPETFEQIEYWTSQTKQYLSAEIPAIIVANKGDLEHRVTRTSIMELAVKLDAPCFMTIATDGTNIREALLSALELVYELRLARDGCLQLPDTSPQEPM